LDLGSRMDEKKWSAIVQRGRVVVVTDTSHGLGVKNTLHLVVNAASFLVNYLNNVDKGEQITSTINSSHGRHTLEVAR
jgi:hypothetical protein